MFRRCLCYTGYCSVPKRYRQSQCKLHHGLRLDWEHRRKDDRKEARCPMCQDFLRHGHVSGDQQLVGSIALLVATIIKLHLHKTLSVYHFELVLGMVSLSSIAFTYAMICYRLRRQWDSEDDGCTQRPQHQQHGLQPWYRRLIEVFPWAIGIFLRLCLAALLLYNILQQE